MKTIVTLLFLFGGLSLKAQVDATPLKPHEDGTPYKIAFVGDSITYGSLVSPGDQNFPIVAGRLLGPKFQVGVFGAIAQTLMKNTGHSYWDTKEFKDATAFGADAVVIMLGTNDSGGEIKDGKWSSADQFEADYTALIQHFQQLPSQPRVWAVLTVPGFVKTSRWEVLDKAIVPIIQKVAAQMNIPTIDLHHPMIGHPEDFPEDVHPNKEGHERMGKIVYAYLSGQPAILPVGTLFDQPFQVSLTITNPGTVAHYTLDGSDPTESSPTYAKPFTVSDTTTVKAAAFGNGTVPGFVPSSVTFTKVPLLPADQAADAQPGFTYSFYQGGNLDNPTGTPAETGVAADFGQLPHNKDKGCGFLLDGYFSVPADGIYTFDLSSYDTSFLTIDDQPVVADPGSKGLYIMVTGQIGLAAGLHKFHIIYSQLTGNNGLGLRYAVPGQELQPFPSAGFFHDKTADSKP